MTIILTIKILGRTYAGTPEQFLELCHAMDMDPRVNAEIEKLPVEERPEQWAYVREEQQKVMDVLKGIGYEISE